MAVRPEKTAILYGRAEALAGLLHNDAFGELQIVAEKKAEKVRKTVLAHVFSGDVDQSFVSQQRGFIDGMNYIVNLVPQGAQADLIEWAEKEVSK